MDTPLTLQLLLTDGLVSGTYYVPTATPALSWQCCSKRAGFYQKNYRILATDINTGETLWDSGVVESDISANIQWGGKPLRSRLSRLSRLSRFSALSFAAKSSTGSIEAHSIMHNKSLHKNFIFSPFSCS